ncbi:MAG: cofactor-independent phosphoglycerate mutase [Thermodesulfovibrionales bacterium]|nr:cofactor-independent phosphoglycerate mutase [Thermodesulfovibrionales bacterium]
MKYVVLIGDGMADRPIPELGGLTPLQKANTPNMDKLASLGMVGIVKTIPKGFHAGSDVANLSILGYDPRIYYTGRAPLEAASIGVTLQENDVAYRCNLVTLRFDNKIYMEDYSSGHIKTEDAKKIIEAIKKELEMKDISFYPGVSYRHLMVWRNGKVDVQCTPPHDILGEEISKYLPKGEGSEFLIDLIYRSFDMLRDHPLNLERKKRNEKPANSIWLWGQGRRPSMPPFAEKYGIKGSLVSAVDLTKGLGIYAGFKILDVPGVTGWLDTNYLGKAEYSLKALEEVDLAYIHVEAPDEAGHSGNYNYKIKAIEDFDSLVVGTIMNGLRERFNEYRILLMPDHATPIEKRTHTDDPVPFIIYDSRNTDQDKNISYDESICNMKDVRIFEDGFNLMDFFVKG